MINFLDVKKRFGGLKPGEQSQVRRLVEPDDLFDIPVFYRLGLPSTMQSARVALFLPVVAHKENAPELGEQLKDVSEQRMFQMMRSNTPADLVALRRLLRQIEPTANWSEFGKSLWYWGDQEKRKLMTTYFQHS